MTRHTNKDELQHRKYPSSEMVSTVKGNALIRACGLSRLTLFKQLHNYLQNFQTLRQTYTLTWESTFSKVFATCLKKRSTLKYEVPEGINFFHADLKFYLLINLKLLIIETFFLLNIAEHEHFSANKYENANLYWNFIFISKEYFRLSWVQHENSFIYSGPGLSPCYPYIRGDILH